MSCVVVTQTQSKTPMANKLNRGWDTLFFSSQKKKEIFFFPVSLPALCNSVILS